jgi:hypothetical protein
VSSPQQARDRHLLVTARSSARGRAEKPALEGDLDDATAYRKAVRALRERRGHNVGREADRTATAPN